LTYLKLVINILAKCNSILFQKFHIHSKVGAVLKMVDYIRLPGLFGYFLSTFL